jgi:type II secretory pathway component PulJ
MRKASRVSRSGFTILEFLVAFAVLALMTVLLAQILSSSSQSWLGGQSRVNNFTKARSMLDLMARDVQAGIFRDDLGAFDSGNLAFYTRRPGVSTNAVRDVSLVRYALDTNSVLQRSDLAIAWTNAAQDVSFGTTALTELGRVTDRDASPGTLGFRVLFLQDDGSLTAAFDPAKTRALTLGLAVVDDRTLAKLSDSQRTALRGGLAAAVSGTNSLSADWNTYLAGLNWASYPADLGRGIKVFERYVLLP